MRRLRSFTGVLLGAKLLNLAINARTFPRLGESRGSGRVDDLAVDDLAVDDLAHVSVCIPARDEADTIGECLSRVLAQGVGQVLVLDDESSDDTARIATRHLSAAVSTKTAVLQGSPLPSGWVGKTWACEQLARAASGSVLLFLDADVRLAPGAIRGIVEEMARQQADVFSVFPRQQTGTLGEHLVLPAIDNAVLTMLPFPLLRLDIPAAATACGACLVFTRSSYDRLGGFGAVRGELVEDVALARLTRRQGLRLGLALGGSLVWVRMYSSYAQIVSGMGRGLVPVAGSRSALVAGWVLTLVVYTLPPLAWVVTRRTSWLLIAAVGVIERLGVEQLTGRRRWAQSLLVPAAPVAAFPVVRQALRRVQTWRSRAYS